ncbi:MAG: hypothetical protein ACJ77B_09495 [Chloroflexota bacterium]
MNGEFSWWLLIVGLVVGAGLVWLVLADSSRRETEVTEEELPAEATWIATTLADAGDDISPETAEHVLRLHRAYLASPPPDEIETWPRPDEPTDDVAEDDIAPATEPEDDAPRWDPPGVRPATGPHESKTAD